MRRLSFNFFSTVKFKVLFMVLCACIGTAIVSGIGLYFINKQKNIFSTSLEISRLSNSIQELKVMENMVLFTGKEIYHNKIHLLLSNISQYLKKSQSELDANSKTYIQKIDYLIKKHKSLYEDLKNITTKINKEKLQLMNFTLKASKILRNIIAKIDEEEALLATEGDLLPQPISALRRQSKTIAILLYANSNNLITNLISDNNIKKYKEEYKKLKREIKREEKNTTVLIKTINRKEFSQKWENIKNFINSVLNLQESFLNDYLKQKASMPKLEKNVASIDIELSNIIKQCSKIIQIMNYKIKKLTIIINGSIILIIVALGIWIFMSIVVTLQKARKYAISISEGDFNTSLNISQKDEVGQVCDALKAIATSLKEIKRRIQTASQKIKIGHLRERCILDGLSGDFKSMLMDINRLSDVLTTHIDNLPIPMMTIDRNFNVLFLSKEAQNMVNTKKEQGKCYELFKTKHCNTDKCACLMAMEQGEKISSETTACPTGKRLEIEYFGLPLVNDKGENVGAVELIVDQTKIKAMMEKMRNVAKDALNISDKVATASEELSAQIDQMAKGAEEQRTRISETATAMEQMNATVLEVAKNASQASESSAKSREEAEEGQNIVDKTISAIIKVKELAQKLEENTKALEDKAESIGQIVQVISEIADQTNLLALNAAIEAARAGEAGRGFAVVADEIRKLAEKTMTATKEVEEAINGIQIASKNNMKNVEFASKAVEETTSMAKESGTALKNIVHLATDTNTQIQGIATAAEEQSASMEEINRSIEHVNEIVAETSDSIIQSSEAIQELAKMAAELRKVIEELES